MFPFIQMSATSALSILSSFRKEALKRIEQQIYTALKRRCSANSPNEKEQTARRAKKTITLAAADKA